jgi:hypothetical protein
MHFDEETTNLFGTKNNNEIFIVLLHFMRTDKSSESNRFPT